mgnify:CR=1 FL=1|jgi:hypothetical protein
MISETFQKIVNPQNVVEHFQTTSSNNYYNLISNMDSECSTIIDKMALPAFSLENNEKSCIVGGRTYAKTDEEYETLRNRNLQKINDKLNEINNLTNVNNTEIHKQSVCLMNKMFSNIKEVTKINNEMSDKNLEKENLTRENELMIERNREMKKKDKDFNLVTNANVIGTNRSKKLILIKYLIFLILIVLFLVIQVIIFFV